jgi:hypothetical protein
MNISVPFVVLNRCKFTLREAVKDNPSELNDVSCRPKLEYLTQIWQSITR